MSEKNYKSSRTKTHKFVGLLIVILLSLVVMLWFATKPFDNFLNIANATPTLQLSADNNSNNKNTTTNSNAKAAGLAKQKLILVNKQNPIPDNYQVDLVELSNGQSVDKSIYPHLQEMFDAARAQGVYPVLVSGYRTAEVQQQLMDEKIATFINEGFSSDKAMKKAKEWVATPGTSEHQLGLAIDINADGINSSGDDVYEWLANNAHTYGFICRYPDNKAKITGINYEPWHYRYVGITAATAMYQQGVCLEEYLNAMD